MRVWKAKALKEKKRERERVGSITGRAEAETITWLKRSFVFLVLSRFPISLFFSPSCLPFDSIFVIFVIICIKSPNKSLTINFQLSPNLLTIL